MYDLYGVTPDYRRLFVAHNYVFYLIEGETIEIVNRGFEKRRNFFRKIIAIVNVLPNSFDIAKKWNISDHEKEDFMYKLFGVSSVDEEAEAYWDDIDYEESF